MPAFAGMTGAGGGEMAEMLGKKLLGKLFG
jgi:hypothetical protein